MTQESMISSVRSLLASVLGCEPGVPPPDLPFSVAGGHSLAAARLVATLRAELGVAVSLVSLLRSDPTPDQLVAMVQSAARASADDLSGPPRSTAYRSHTRAPLSRLMQPLWAFHRLYPESPAYNVMRVLTVPGQIRPAALRGAAAELAERHDALRSCILETRPGEPEVVVRPQSVPIVSAEVIHDHLLDREPDWEVAVPPLVEAAVRAAADRPFDMTVAPLWRLHLVYEPRFDRTWLLLAMHHLISDLRASDIVLLELAVTYERRLSSPRASAPDLPPTPSLVEYLMTEAEYTTSTAAQTGADLAWWSRILGDRPVPRRLPLTGAPASDDEFRADSEIVTLDAEPVDRLARTLRVTSATVLLTASLITLTSWRDGDDVDIAGIPSVRIRRPEDQNLVGFLVDTIPVQCKLEPQTSFADACATVRAAYLDCLEHTSGTIGELMAHLHIPRESARSSLVSLWFNDLTHSRRPSRFGGADCTEPDLAPGWALFDLGLYVQRRASVLRLHGVATRSTFPPGTLRSLITQIARVVQRAITDPGQQAARLVAPNPAPPPRRETAAGTPLAEAVREHAARVPAATAICCSDRTIRYQELAERMTCQAAHWGSGSRIALGASRSPEHVVNLLAATAASASVVLIDPSWPAARQLAAIEVAGVTETAGLGEEITAAARFVPRHPGYGGLAIQFTSGSTGIPLAVATRHSVRETCLADLARWSQVTAADRVSFLSGPSHDPSWRDIGLPLLVGGSLHIPPENVQRDLGQVLAWMRAEGITVASATAPLLALAVAADAVPLPRLRILISGGAPLSAPLARQLRAIAPSATIINGYGCTETPQLLTALVLRPGETIPDNGDLPVGQPLPGRLAEVRTKSGLPCDVGQLGSIWAAAPLIADGYLGPTPDGDGLTATRFRKAEDMRWFDTGDLARRDADSVFVLAGRADRQCLINGHRVVLDDIESVARAADVVGAAIASVIGSGDRASVRLAVQPVSGAKARPDEIRELVWQRLRDKLPVTMIPASIVVTGSLPMTANLKVAAAEPVATQQPALAATDRSPLPSAAMEIVRLAESVLGAPLELADNFFEAGFTSLTLLHLTAKLGVMLERDIPSITLFRFPSLQRLLAYLGIIEAAKRPAPASPGTGSVRDRRRQLRSAIRSRFENPAP